MKKQKIDPFVYRLVVGTLSCTLIVCAVGAIWLEANGMNVPNFLENIGTASLGALVGVLTPVPENL